MGAMSMTFRGTVEVTQRDDAAHTAVIAVRSKDTGGSGYANADVTFDLADDGGRSTRRRRSAARPRRWGGRRADRPRRDDQGLHHEAEQDLSDGRADGHAAGAEGEVPPDGATALQDDPARPVFRANGPSRLRVRRVRERARRLDGDRADDQARADQVRRVQDGQRRRVRREGRDVTAFRKRPPARRTRGSSAGRAASSTTSTCPACCTARSCARPTRTRRSSGSTPRRPRSSTRRCTPCSPPAELGDMAWMPTLSADTQAVLAGDRVLFQGQEVAFVVADDRYSARDALELIEVEYEPLPAVTDARAALSPDATPGARRGQPRLRLGGRRRRRHRARVRPESFTDWPRMRTSPSTETDSSTTETSTSIIIEPRCAVATCAGGAGLLSSSQACLGLRGCGSGFAQPARATVESPGCAAGGNSPSWKDWSL